MALHAVPWMPNTAWTAMSVGTVRFEATKMKDAPIPDPLAFHLRTVELGMTDDEG
jgi:hypothetical protein